MVVREAGGYRCIVRSATRGSSSRLLFEDLENPPKLLYNCMTLEDGIEAPASSLVATYCMPVVNKMVYGNTTKVRTLLAGLLAPVGGGLPFNFYESSPLAGVPPPRTPAAPVNVD
jgi:hypothetical protein